MSVDADELRKSVKEGYELTHHETIALIDELEKARGEAAGKDALLGLAKTARDRWWEKFLMAETERDSARALLLEVLPRVKLRPLGQSADRQLEQEDMLARIAKELAQ